jgi:hypothetical protein
VCTLQKLSRFIWLYLPVGGFQKDHNAMMSDHDDLKGDHDALTKNHNFMMSDHTARESPIKAL